METAIASKVIIDRDSNEKKVFFYKLQIKHLDEILLLQNIVWSKMEDREKYVPLEREEFEFILSGHGIAIGAFVEHKFVGMFALVFPKYEDNCGKDIGLSSEELSFVVHSESAFVLPTVQGNKLLLEMKRLALKQAKKIKNYKYILATIHPDNLASLQSHLASKLYIIQLKKKYNNLWRYILIHNVEKPIAFESISTIEVGIEDKERQIELFNNGYIGFRLLNKKNRTYLSMAKRKKL